MNESDLSIESVAAQAFRWVLELRGEQRLSLETRRRFGDWLQRSPEHVRQFLLASVRYAQMKGLTPISPGNEAHWLERARRITKVVVDGDAPISMAETLWRPAARCPKNTEKEAAASANVGHRVLRLGTSALAGAAPMITTLWRRTAAPPVKVGQRLLRLCISALATSISSAETLWRANVRALKDSSRRVLASQDDRLLIRKRRVPAMAATAIAVIVISAALELRPNEPWVSYQSAAEQGANIPLKDGSTLMLFPASRVRTRISNQGRRVQIAQGGAIFSVVPDAARLFRVEVTGGSIEALGANFSVTGSESLTHIHVDEGTVWVSNSQQAVVLQAGSDTQIRANGQIEPARLKETRVLEIHDSSLAQIAASFNRSNALQILVQGSARDLRLSGYLDSNDARSLLEALENFPDLVIQIQGTSAIVRRRRDVTPAADIRPHRVHEPNDLLWTGLASARDWPMHGALSPSEYYA